MVKKRELLKVAISAAFGIAVFFFWLFGYPQALNYHEENQLFLFTCDYFFRDISVVGGLADYVAESIVQFYYIPWIGAMMLGILYGTMQWLVWKVFYRFGGSYVLSFLPPLLLLWHMGDINAMLSLPVALTLVLALFVLIRNRFLLADVVILPVAYWYVGPVVAVYALLRMIGRGWRVSIVYLAGFFVCSVVAYWQLSYQYPYSMVLTGVNYYFRPLYHPCLQFVAPLSIPAISTVTHYFKAKTGWRKPLSVLQVVMVVAIGVSAWTMGYDKDMYELLMQDKLVREGKWNEIISRAEKYQVPTSFSSNCVNLALAATRQLADRMFDFYQSGEDALVAPRMRDNMSSYPTMETFWRLGMVNSSLRYASDLQESILNARKSGRLTKRIVQCQMVNGRYAIARKNIDLLRHSLFYSEWATKAEAMLGDEAAIDNDNELGRVRQLRFRKEMVYSYDEIDKMCGLLFIDNNSNKMALDYFMGNMLLKGNIQGFMQYMSWVQQYGGYYEMPRGYKDAVNCIQKHGNAPGSRYAEYVRRMMDGKGGQE